MSHDSNRFADLIRRLRAGSREAANELAEQYARAVRVVVQTHMHESLRPKFESIDFEQQVWKSFFAEAKSLPEFKNPQHLIAYLAGMVQNKLADENRQLNTQKRDIHREVRIDERAKVAGPHPVSREPTPSAMVVFKEQWERLVEGQSEEVRQIVIWRIEGLTYAQIAERLGVSERTVRQKMYDLSARLHLDLKDHSPSGID